MKMTVFATNSKQDVDNFPRRAAGGHKALGVIDPEEELITELDEQRMSPEKIAATRFLKFLGDQRLDMQKLKSLSPEQQARLRKEFLGE